MRDPHVAALHYRIETPESVTFDSPLAVEAAAPAFTVWLADGRPTTTMNEHHASEESARAVVEPYLRAWEIGAGLQQGRQEMRFTFRRAELVERDPPPGTTSVRLSSTLTIGASVALVFERAHYPAPLQGFAVSPDVETLWRRYQGYLDGKEPLLSMAYFCLTVLEARTGKTGEKARRTAAALYNVDFDVLNTLGELSSTRGDERTARKVSSKGQRCPPTGQEIAWIEAAIKALIRRVGEAAHNPQASLPKITLSDLPQL